MGCSLFAQSRQLFGEVECNQTTDRPMVDDSHFSIMFQTKSNQMNVLGSDHKIHSLLRRVVQRPKFLVSFETLLDNELSRRALIRLLRMSLKIGSFVHTRLSVLCSSHHGEMKLNINFRIYLMALRLKRSYTFSDTLWSKSCVLKGRQRTKSVQSSATIVVHFILRRLRLSLTRIFVCAFFKRKHIFRISDIFEAEDSTKKEIIMCYAPHLSGKKVTRDLSRGQRRKKGNLHIFWALLDQFFFLLTISSLLLHINIIYIFTLLSSESKNSLKSRRMMNTRPLKHDSRELNWVESFFSRSLSCIFSTLEFKMAGIDWWSFLFYYFFE